MMAHREDYGSWLRYKDRCWYLIVNSRWLSRVHRRNAWIRSCDHWDLSPVAWLLQESIRIANGCFEICSLTQNRRRYYERFEYYFRENEIALWPRSVQGTSWFQGYVSCVSQGLGCALSRTRASSPQRRAQWNSFQPASLCPEYRIPLA